jgi:transposase InsO family protein
MTKSSYYSRIRTTCEKQQNQEKLDFHVFEQYHNPSKDKISGIDGYRMIHQKLIVDEVYRAHELNDYQVLKSMQKLGIRSITQKRREKQKRGDYCEAFEDLVKGKYIQQVCNQVWYTDFTYVKVKGTFYYVCLILDGCDGDVIARQVSRKIDAHLACDTLEQALAKNKPKKPVILHSDQGGQYRSKRFTALCKTSRVIESMSRAGTPVDNALMESFMGKLKTERLHHLDITSLAQLDSETSIYCSYYNAQRLHSRHGYLTIEQVKFHRTLH